jgi:hypothetical protein
VWLLLSWTDLEQHTTEQVASLSSRAIVMQGTTAHSVPRAGQRTRLLRPAHPRPTLQARTAPRAHHAAHLLSLQSNTRSLWASLYSAVPIRVQNVVECSDMMAIGQRWLDNHTCSCKPCSWLWFCTNRVQGSAICLRDSETRQPAPGQAAQDASKQLWCSPAWWRVCNLHTSTHLPVRFGDGKRSGSCLCLLQ